MESNNRFSYHTKEDQTQKISKLVFVKNFPDHFKARDLWNACVTYVWIGRFHLHTNVVRFQRNPNPNTPHPNVSQPMNTASMKADKNSFAAVLKSSNIIPNTTVDSSSAIVLDDSCLIERDFSFSLMGKIKDINSMSNLYFILANEGFENVNLSYLGESNEKISKHVGVGSWFHELKQTCSSFVTDERMVWIFVEGLPLKAYTRNTFAKIVSPWGELTDVEDSDNSSLSFKSLVSEFIAIKEDSSSFDEESEGDFKENTGGNFNIVNEDDIDHVYESSCITSSTDEDEPKFAPGFTPDVDVEENVKDFNSEETSQPKNVLVDNNERVTSDHTGSSFVLKIKASGSILDVMEEMIKGNFCFDYALCPSIGYSGGILCVWDPRSFVKDNVTVSYSFLAISGKWVASSTKLLIIAVYALQELSDIKILWDYFHYLIDSWDGECLILGDFNEVCFENERYGSVFNLHGANTFNNFITMAGLVDIPLEGHSFTWSHKLASKMSKLDRFLITEGLLSLFLSLSALCLDRHLSDHRPILMRELNIDVLESVASYDEIKKAIWDCGINKSHGPDCFIFEFFRRYWEIIDQDVVAAVLLFFYISSFSLGCNSSFIALISKTQDAKMVKDFRPIILIGSMYKIIAKILANRFSLVILDLVSDVQSAFSSNRQILDGLFILNELLSWCKHKNIKAMIFKVDFEKAFDLVRWDFLDEVLHKFGFGDKWRSWIQGCLSSAMGSILVNGSPTSEFKFFKGLKQGDPLSPLFFILIMESFHVLFSNVLNAGLYKGIRIDDSLCLSHLFYVDDVVFMGKWDSSNFSTIVNAFQVEAQKLKTLFIGGRLTLIKSVLSSLPLHYFSLFKVPKGILNKMEASRRNFFNGVDNYDRKMSLSGWKKILASKKNGGLGVRFMVFEGLLIRVTTTLDVLRGLTSFENSRISSIQETPPLVEVLKRNCCISLVTLLLQFFFPIQEIDRFRVCLGKLPTRLNLSLHGLDIPLILCPNCYVAVESTAHLFFSCDLTRQLSRMVSRWWEVELHDFQSYGDWLTWFSNLRFSKRLKDVFEGV
nr:RNA-directed DNA polymerase, eukaryota, reverse transcriptase zinc-binding domain protein [Tanacetum cinerariifolium]